MTQEEQYTILGKTRMEYREARNRFGAVKKRNATIAAAAKNLVHALEYYPDCILVPKGPQEAQGTIARALSMDGVKYVYGEEDASCLNPESLRAHLEEYVNAQQRRADLRQQLIEQGEDDPEK
jgi:hypothetical protein